MTGIAGWVAFDRKLGDAEQTIGKMLGTLELRGPEGAQVWSDSRTALGRCHRGDDHPMYLEESGHGLATVAFSGQLYNAVDLRRQLVSHGHEFRTNSVAEVVIRGYLQWGSSLAERLEGFYAFAIWDVRRKKLLLVRDRLGVEPLYYYRTADGLLFGSEPKAILSHPYAESVLDAESLREIFAFVKTPGQAVFSGMRELRPGHELCADVNGLRTRAYWSLEAHPHTDDLETTVQTVRDLLGSAVERQVIADPPAGALLSGGLDSSTLAALASGILAERGDEALHTFGLDFVGYTEGFQPDEKRGSPDAPFVRELTRHIPTRHADVVIDTLSLMDPRKRAAVLQAVDVPIGMGDLNTSLYLLLQAVRPTCAAVLSGEAADELFGGYRWQHDAEVVRRDTFPWIARMDPRTGFGAALLDPGLVERLDVPSYQAQRYQEALREVPRLPGEEGEERRMREVNYLALTRFAQLLLDRRDRVGQAAGVEMRVPFTDHRLVQYAFNIPWSMKSRDGIDKSVLRAAMKDTLPEAIARRPKSHFPQVRDPAYDQALRQEVKELLAKTDPPVRPFLNAGRVRDLTHGERVLTMDDRIDMETIVEINECLIRYGARVTV
ncbi:asparagine synthase (glutamine-hydrolyzing) [Actinomadura sp. 7K507]|uniref:asparagine synthase (glutamine-hydrolyzing) n=1 Tax=Actinomadura sp. 7K507 TaxID=2530365 RepID=UPI001046E34D|nr:asparagine synthase (glutamine-hydrolyzing) [Actinomadura sp. 7K507]TDC86441.1 asparagine synthase (glutamine-hydrolyzing) [Actinomadura sp. 7K507]